jgi:hypothetical protein
MLHVTHIFCCRRPPCRKGSGAHKLLETATQRTIHAHAFCRSSTHVQASFLLIFFRATCLSSHPHAQNMLREQSWMYKMLLALSMNLVSGWVERLLCYRGQRIESLWTYHRGGLKIYTISNVCTSISFIFPFLNVLTRKIYRLRIYVHLS